MNEFVAQSPFFEITVLLVLAAVFGFLGIVFRQPLIVSFIALGLIVGPSGLDVVHSEAKIELLAELGITLLLFLVGIKLDTKLIKSIGLVSLMTGLGQVVFTSLFGFGIGLLLGLTAIESFYVAVALTFSSTIIIVKLLSDKREIDALHGQIALGFLIVQDLVVVFSMVVLAAIGMGAESQISGASDLTKVALSGFLLLIFVVIFIKYLATPLTVRLASAPELLVVFAIAFAALFATIGKVIGLGLELGGLLAGVALASTPIKESLSSRLGPLRDFLLLFFFIALGSMLDLRLLGDYVFSAIVFSLFVLIGNPLIVLLIMGVLGYRRRTAFLAGLTVAQISEFSLIFVSMGIVIGHLTTQILGLVTLVGLITIAISTYMITYSHAIYNWLEPVLSVFERKNPFREAVEGQNPTQPYDVLVFGLGRFGRSLASKLLQQEKRVLGIDFNPFALEKAKRLNIPNMYGDVTDAEFIAELPLKNVRLIVTTVPTHHLGLTIDDTRKTVAQLTDSAGFMGKLAVVSHNESEFEALREVGIDVVLQPYLDASSRAAEIIVEALQSNQEVAVHD